MSYCKPFMRGVSWRSQNFGANATIYGPHSGNDDAAPIGTPVHAAGDGFIEWAGEFDDTYHDNLLWLLRMGGNIAVLNCGDDEPTFVYGHMDSFTVKRGDWVRKGQVIGYSGNTGTATTGAHLHTEAIPPGYVLNSPMLGRVNPDIYLTEWPEDINTGSLSYASETITPLEDFMATLSENEKQWMFDVLGALSDNAATKKDLREVVEPRTLAPNEKEWQFAVLRSLADNAATKRDIDKVLEAGAIAASVPDELVQGVAELLAARMEGK